MSERKVLKYVEMINKREKVEHALHRLEQIPMTLEMLSSTGVGKVVNRLKNHDEYGVLATRIVDGWRQVAIHGGGGGRKSPEASASGADDDNSGNESATERSEDHNNSTPMKIAAHCRSLSKTTSAEKPSAAAKKQGVKRLSKPPAQIDAFAAALSSADKVKVPKTKKPRESYMDEVEKSLMAAVRAPPIVLKPIVMDPLPPSATSKPSSSASNNDIGIVKAKMGSHKVYAGRRKAGPIDGKVPRLFDICMRFCINNIDAIEETGDIPFHVLKPMLENCTHTQLAKIESKNRYLEEDTDYLWEKHCQDVFPNEPCGDDESWKHCFFRLTHEREERLKRLSAKIGANTRETAQPQRKAMFADPIAPRDARRRQIKNGIVCHSSAVPTAAELSRSRRQIFETGSADELRKVHPAVRNTTKSKEKPVNYSASSSSSSAHSSGTSSGGGGGRSSMSAIFAVRKTAPKKGALMVKTLKMLKAKRN